MLHSGVALVDTGCCRFCLVYGKLVHFAVMDGLAAQPGAPDPRMQSRSLALRFPHWDFLAVLLLALASFSVECLSPRLLVTVGPLNDLPDWLLIQCRPKPMATGTPIFYYWPSAPGNALRLGFCPAGRDRRAGGGCCHLRYEALNGREAQLPC